MSKSHGMVLVYCLSALAACGGEQEGGASSTAGLSERDIRTLVSRDASYHMIKTELEARGCTFDRSSVVSAAHDTVRVFAESGTCVPGNRRAGIAMSFDLLGRVGAVHGADVDTSFARPAELLGVRDGAVHTIQQGPDFWEKFNAAVASASMGQRASAQGEIQGHAQAQFATAVPGVGGGSPLNGSCQPAVFRMGNLNCCDAVAAVSACSAWITNHFSGWDALVQLGFDLTWETYLNASERSEPGFDTCWYGAHPGQLATGTCWNDQIADVFNRYYESSGYSDSSQVPPEVQYNMNNAMNNCFNTFDLCSRTVLSREQSQVCAQTGPYQNGPECRGRKDGEHIHSCYNRLAGGSGLVMVASQCEANYQFLSQAGYAANCNGTSLVCNIVQSQIQQGNEFAAAAAANLFGLDATGKPDPRPLTGPAAQMAAASWNSSGCVQPSCLDIPPPPSMCSAAAESHNFGGTQKTVYFLRATDTPGSQMGCADGFACAKDETLNGLANGCQYTCSEGGVYGDKERYFGEDQGAWSTAVAKSGGCM